MKYMFFFILLIKLFLLLMYLMPSNLYKFNPLNLNLLLIIYTILLTFFMNFFSTMYWFSYIMFLAMVGGLMILFMYFTSLTNNNLFYINKNYIYSMIKLFFLLIIFLMIYKFNLLNNLNFNFFFELNKFNMLFLLKNNFLYKNLMMDFIINMNIFMILYLFFMMICSILICSKNLIPLRQIKKN